jgi:protein-tyrosine phosphatase
LYDYGVRTIIDLRNDDERQTQLQKPSHHEDLKVTHLPHDGADNVKFWSAYERGPAFGSTPLYYQPHLEEMPQRSARVIAAVANAPPGGVLFHCMSGRDRTGLIAVLILKLLGVSAEHIVSDYEQSDERLLARYKRLGQNEPGGFIKQYLAEKGTTAGEVIISFLDTFDVEEKLRTGGLTGADIENLRQRLFVRNSDRQPSR